MKLFYLSCIAVLALSCKMQTNADKRYVENENTAYKLRLNPDAGSQYYYDISNESKVKMEADDKKVDNLNKSEAGMVYAISKDSSGNFRLKIFYDKIHLYLKSGDKETEMDADNADVAINPVEKMLGALKAAQITATVSPKGEVKETTGYKELGAQLMDGIQWTDAYAKQMAQTQWDQMIGQGLVKKNMDQLFTIFPDSAVRIGDKWKLISKQEGEFGLHVKAFYRLKDIEDGVAHVEVEGEMLSDSSLTNLMGYNATAQLKGNLQGEYKVETQTGMLISSAITSKLEGTIQMMGREIPVDIENTLKMEGRKVK